MDLIKFLESHDKTMEAIRSLQEYAESERIDGFIEYTTVIQEYINFLECELISGKELTLGR